MLSEHLPDGHVWLRIANADWLDPLDPTFAARTGGRWNPPLSFATLYLNEDRVTARLNLRLFISEWPYEPEDLRDQTGPVLVLAELPPAQRAVDVHTPQGVAAVGLPPTYPIDAAGATVPHARCRPIGAAAKRAGLHGIRARSAREPQGAGRELAWFPEEPERPRQVGRESFEAWYYG